MLITGLPISAEEALRAGLISKLAKDPEDLDKV
jgi:enoyl-CoA hydratase/carnithine racemase